MFAIMRMQRTGLGAHLPPRLWALGLLIGLLPGVGALTGCAGTPVDQRHGKQVASRALSPQRAEIVMAGLAQVGTPYGYGQSAPGQGFDCSGLTQYAHAQAGLMIPRVSTAQRAAAQAVPRNALAPGDLVFFKTGVRQYHVGIMVDSEHFVHASTSRDEVHLSPLSGPYWTKRFLGAGTFVAEPRFADQALGDGRSPFGEL